MTTNHKKARTFYTIEQMIYVAKRSSLFVYGLHLLPDNRCGHCLSDCSRIIYQKTITAQQFRQCDEKNFGAAQFCTFDGPLTTPHIWGHQVRDQVRGYSIYDVIAFGGIGVMGFVTTGSKMIQNRHLWGNPYFNNYYVSATKRPFNFYFKYRHK